MFKLMTIALLSSTIALGPCMATSEMVEDRQPITTENVKRVIYDDENYSITFSVNELNNYTYPNLTNYLSGHAGYLGGSSVSYDGNNLSYSYYVSGRFVYDISGRYIQFNNNVMQFQYYKWVTDNFYKQTFTTTMNLNLTSSQYSTIKGLIEKDIKFNNRETLFDNIYHYFDDNVFDSNYLNDYEMEIMGHTTSMRHYLCLTATIIFITLIVIFCVGFIVMLVKFVANMLINLGR